MIIFDRGIFPLDAEALDPKPFVWHIQLLGVRGWYYRPSWEQLLGNLFRRLFKNTLRAITNYLPEVLFIY